MAVRIRLSRIGRKKTPFYNLVAIDSRSKRDGAFLSDIGTYDGLKGVVVSFKEDIYKDWLSKGAIPSDSAKKVYRVYQREMKKKEAQASQGNVAISEEGAKKASLVKKVRKETSGEGVPSAKNKSEKAT